MIATISNPPYNMKWNIPDLAKTQKRFTHTVLPPSSNANYAFILTALEESDRCIFILPGNVLSSKLKNETEIRKYLIEKNYIDSIIACPNKMFESTDISVIILVLDKNKSTTTIEFIDAREKYDTETRQQRGQYGGSSHTNRVYEKNIKVFNDDTIDDIIRCINNRKTIKNYCKCGTIEDVKNNNYILDPKRYIEFYYQEPKTRSYEDIINDINRIVDEKNKCKLTVNQTVAKNVGLNVELFQEDNHKENKELNDLTKKIAGLEIKKSNYFQMSKKKNEVKFENNSKEDISSVLMLIFNMWSQHIYYLNEEENRYLVELRDKLLPDLISGKIEV